MIPENVIYGWKETGSNYSRETGYAWQKPEMIVCFKTLNFPGGQHQIAWGRGRNVLEGRSLTFHNLFDIGQSNLG